MARLSEREFLQLSKAEKRLIMFEDQGGECWYCGEQMTFQPTPGPLPQNFATFEHITPMHYGTRRHGKAELNKRCNKVLACLRCNNIRSDRPLTWFIAKLREAGFTRGIVSRIRHLVNDHTPRPWQASEFEWYMLQALAYPRRPGDALKRLPASLETAILPDPAEPLPVRQAAAGPPPKRRAPPLVVRFFRALWRCTDHLRRVLHRKELACR